jgi:hypothetical protein
VRSDLFGHADASLVLKGDDDLHPDQPDLLEGIASFVARTAIPSPRRLERTQ